jgi:hypothetical protein
LRPVEAIGLTAGGSIKQLTAFDYAGSELRQVVAASDEYAIPASQQAISTMCRYQLKDRLKAVFQNRRPSIYGRMPALRQHSR